MREMSKSDPSEQVSSESRQALIHIIALKHMAASPPSMLRAINHQRETGIFILLSWRDGETRRGEEGKSKREGQGREGKKRRVLPEDLEWRRRSMREERGRRVSKREPERERDTALL